MIPHQANYRIINEARRRIPDIAPEKFCYLKRKRKINAKIATILTDFAPHSQWLVGSDYTDYFFVAHDKMKSYLLSQNIEENKIFVMYMLIL